MIAASLSPDLLVGLGFGVVLGLLIGPVVRSWLAWREWVSASREADLVADVLDRMEVAPWPEHHRAMTPNGNADGKATSSAQRTPRRDAP